MVSHVHQVNADTDLAPTFKLFGGRAQHRNNGGPFPEATQCTPSSNVSGAFQAAGPLVKFAVSIFDQ